MSKLSNYGGTTRLPYAFEVTPTKSLHQMTYGGFPRQGRRIIDKNNWTKVQLRRSLLCSNINQRMAGR